MPRTYFFNENEYKVYYSELGDNFLLFHEWVLINLTEKERELMKDINFFHTEFGKSCNQNWKRDQKITSVHCYKDNLFESSGGIEEDNTYKMTIQQWYGIDS